MTMNPLPPQAYTKDILLKAYQWLMGQNSSLKEMATTPDILVSLYLKATRDGDHALDRPSIQNFKNELRSLAGMMGELDRPPTTHQAPPAKNIPPAGATYATVMPPNDFRTAPATETKISYSEKTLTATTKMSSDPLETLDGTSRAMIQEVKEEFNLSCETEALRMLVKLGHTRARALLG